MLHFSAEPAPPNHPTRASHLPKYLHMFIKSLTSCVVSSSLSPIPSSR